MQTNLAVKKMPGVPRETREAQRQECLGMLKRNISGWQKDFNELDYYRIFLNLLDKKLALSQSSISSGSMTDIAWDTREQVFSLFIEVSLEIKDFQQTEKEGKLLFADLLVWVAGEVARLHTR